MQTIELTIRVDDDLQEYLIAELIDLDFDAFLQEDDGLRACIPAPRWSDMKREQIERWLLAHGQQGRMEERVLASQNWNRHWEETIQPIAVPPFLIKPTWAARPPEHEHLILLEIDPKMSFGTGYHESTRLALRFLPDLVRPGDCVLDAGTGTGILAVAAIKLGAASAVAFDIDEWAQQNAVENFYLNEVADQVTFREGALDAVPETGFDLILANINRNVLIEYMSAFAGKLNEGGRLVLAGLLQQDRETILDVLAEAALQPMQEATEGAWWAVTARKR